MFCDWDESGGGSEEVCGGGVPGFLGGIGGLERSQRGEKKVTLYSSYIPCNFSSSSEGIEQTGLVIRKGYGEHGKPAVFFSVYCLSESNHALVNSMQGKKPLPWL